MILAAREADRIRWRCRRGMLEIDIVLNAFVARHLESLDARQLAAFLRLLDRIDPELFDLVMGREVAADEDERAVLALMHVEHCVPGGAYTPGEIRVVNG